MQIAAASALAGWIGTRFETMAAADFWRLNAGLALVAMLGFALFRATLGRQTGAVTATG
jgi:hypothetical protein